MVMMVNQRLAKRLDQSEIDVLYSRLHAIKGLEGNPMEIEMQRFGNATAFTTGNILGPSFNTVKGLEAEDENQIDNIIHFYKQKNIPVQFELSPAQTSPGLLASLHDRGFYQSGFHTMLYHPLVKRMEVGEEEAVAIRRLKSDEFELFADIYTKAFQMPAFLKPAVAQNNQILYGVENWTFYLASVQGEPAGVGVLFVKDRVASLAAAATMPTL